MIKPDDWESEQRLRAKKGRAGGSGVLNKDKLEETLELRQRRYTNDASVRQKLPRAINARLSELDTKPEIEHVSQALVLSCL